MLSLTESPAPGKDKLTKNTWFSSSEFEKKLRWMIGNPPRDAERWRITPTMAEVMLKWNTRNRPLKATAVKDYTKSMLAGRWHYTGEPIIFSTERLLDGQNRLTAVIASGATIECLVVFGAPDDAFAWIDTGAARTPGDVFAINGVKNYNHIASATQWVAGFESGSFANAAKGNLITDRGQLYEIYLRHAGLQDSMWVANAIAPKKIVSPSMMMAMHYMCAQKSRPEADAFFTKVAEGVGFDGKRDPAYKLHEHLVQCAIAQTRPGRKTAAALVIKAWNAARRGRDVGLLRFTADEAFPKII